MKPSQKLYHSRVLTALTAVAAASGCTGQLPGSFRLAQQEQTFNAQLDINTKIDLLWVVDNSSSMDVSQEKLRKGFDAFARKYMQPTWDIRVAVITTDTYLADSAFNPYLSGVVPGTTGWRSPYIYSRLSTFVNPSWNASLVNLSTGYFDSGVKYKEMVPAWGPNFAKLLPGLHDGPIAGLCFEGMPYFLNGVTQCSIRDNQNGNTGAANCLNPSGTETSLTQCVNTVQNDTIRSGRAIISTMPSSPLSGTALTNWTNQLVNDFMVNVTTGSVGHGSERGFGSLLQMIQDNETSDVTKFFRPDSLRGIVFVSDEDDQTLTIESTPAAGFNPFSHYQCDQASLIAMNGSAAVTGPNGFCCTGAGCRFGSEGTFCSSKTVDGYTYTLSVCPRQDLLKPVSEVKSALDTFFLGIDGANATNPNYFVVSIVPLTGQAIQDLQASRNHDDTLAGGFHTFAVDRGDRYLELGNLVGNGSLAMNIADQDYTPILNAIGASIIEKKSTFKLSRAPTAAEDMVVLIMHADGTSTVIPMDKYIISGSNIVITDQNLVLSFAATDKILINYQPKTLH